MQAFEFQTIIQDGVIRISDRLEKKEQTPFPFFGVDTTGYVFDREEANER